MFFAQSLDLNNVYACVCQSLHDCVRMSRVNPSRIHRLIKPFRKVVGRIDFVCHISASASSEDGRLCAAAFVQDRRSYTGCTDAPNPSGGSGRAWCYVEAQACSASWEYACMV